MLFTPDCSFVVAVLLIRTGAGFKCTPLFDMYYVAQTNLILRVKNKVNVSAAAKIDHVSGGLKACNPGLCKSRWLKP